MFPSLQAKLARYEELERQLQDPAVFSDTSRLSQVQREFGGLAKIALKVREFNRLEQEVATARQMGADETDAELKDYARAEAEKLAGQLTALQQELEDVVLAGDAATRGSLIMEI